MKEGKTRNCPQCGNTVAETDQFCSKCSARLEPPGLWRKFLSRFRFAGRPGPRILNIKKTVTINTIGEDGQTHEYHSLDEVPPGIRAEIEKLQSELMKEKGGSVSVTETSSTEEVTTSAIIKKQSVTEFRIKDASGNQWIYRSLDELPPDVRALVEGAQKQGELEK